MYNVEAPWKRWQNKLKSYKTTFNWKGTVMNTDTDRKEESNTV